MLLGYSPRYGGLLYIINVLKFFLVMNAKEFLGGLLEENKPQVVFRTVLTFRLLILKPKKLPSTFAV